VVAGALKGTGSIAGGLTVNATGTIAPGIGVWHLHQQRSHLARRHLCL
jgi:hypothetical protein